MAGECPKCGYGWCWSGASEKDGGFRPARLMSWGQERCYDENCGVMKKDDKKETDSCR